MSEPLEKSDPAPGSVDWNGAEAYMRGAKDDGEGAGAEHDETAAREFKYRGKTVTVDPATHELLESLKNEARGTNGRLGSELARTRERLATLEGVVSAQRTSETRQENGPTPPDPLLATRDIAAWQRQYDDYHSAKTASQMEALEKKHFAFVKAIEVQTGKAQAEKAWADQFYGSYDHLDSPAIKPIVAQSYTEHREELDGLDRESAHERLAELVDERLLLLRSSGRESEPKNSRRPPRLESSAGPTPRGKSEEAPRDFSAASWVAKQRLKMNGREPRKER